MSRYTWPQLHTEFVEDLWDKMPEKAAQMAGIEDFVSGNKEMDDIAKRLEAGEDIDKVFEEWEREAEGSVTDDVPQSW